jgi:hypothetical protein
LFSLCFLNLNGVYVLPNQKYMCFTKLFHILANFNSSYPRLRCRSTSPYLCYVMIEGTKVNIVHGHNCNCMLFV